MTQKKNKHTLNPFIKMLWICLAYAANWKYPHAPQQQQIGQAHFLNDAEMPTWSASIISFVSPMLSIIQCVDKHFCSPLSTFINFFRAPLHHSHASRCYSSSPSWISLEANHFYVYFSFFLRFFLRAGFFPLISAPISFFSTGSTVSHVCECALSCIRCIGVIYAGHFL